MKSTTTNSAEPTVLVLEIRITHSFENPSGTVSLVPKQKRGGSKRDSETILRGEDHPLAKLTASKVRTLRKLAATGRYSNEQLGKRYRVSASCARHVVGRLTWKHVN